MTVLDTFKTIDSALLSALTELENALARNSITPSKNSNDGMIEEWIHDFSIPSNEGIFRLKFTIERTNEHGTARLPIIPQFPDCG